MEYNLNKRVKELCRINGLQLKDLAARMGIAPESLSRAINGNPQLSTLKGIADNLGVSISDLFTKHQQVPLNAIIVYKDKTFVAYDLNTLKLCIEEIECNSDEE